MINIRPVSDLRNKFTEIEQTVKNGEPVYLTKNGYGSMVVLSLEQTMWNLNWTRPTGLPQQTAAGFPRRNCSAG